MSDVKEGNSENNCATALTPRKVFKPKFPSLWIFGRAQDDQNKTNCSNSLFQPSENQVLKNGSDEVKASPGSGLNFGIHDSTEYGALAKGDSPPLYYGVSLPLSPEGTDENEEPLVFTDKKEALRVVKKYKGARFKVFQNVEDAVAFASLPPDEICPTPTSKAAEVPETEKAQDALALKPDPFRGPKSQDMVKLRKAIETGDVDFFLEKVWSNPRYLISSCDTPAILQEGFRYNGLHVAAKYKQPDMCRLILNTIEDPFFIELMYNEDTESSRVDRQRYVLDLYLNTPDKGLCETPLHFASKFGCLEAVEILAFHPCCDKRRKNKYGLEAREIICERCPSASPELKKKIEAVFEEHVFVPVYRSEDNSVQPVVGEPYSLNDPRTPYTHSPVISPDSPLDTSLSVVAVAGPLSPEDASDLYLQWKTPSNTVNTREASIMSRIRLSDPDKGLERIGRYLAQSVKAPWTEYWPSLEVWCDLSSEAGLQKLEARLKFLYDSLSRKLLPGHEQGQKIEKQDLENFNLHYDGDSSSSPDLLKSADANNISSNSSSSSGISSLCHRLEDLRLSDCDDSLLNTSPDMPRVLKSRGDPFEQSESPLNSADAESYTEKIPVQTSTPENRLGHSNSVYKIKKLNNMNKPHVNTGEEIVNIRSNSLASRRRRIFEYDELSHSNEPGRVAQGKDRLCESESMLSGNNFKPNKWQQRLDHGELNFVSNNNIIEEEKYIFKNKFKYSTPKTGDCFNNHNSGDAFCETESMLSENNCQKPSNWQQRLDPGELNCMNKNVIREEKYLFKNKFKFSTPKIGDCVNNHCSEDDKLPNSIVSPSVVILVKNIVHVFAELLMNPEVSVRPQTTLHKFLADDVLPHVKCLYESALGNSCEKETVHCDVAIKVYRQIRSLFVLHEIRLIMQHLTAYLETKLFNVSSDDEVENYRKRSFVESKCLNVSSNAMWKQLMCILVFLNTFLSNNECLNNISVTRCHCMWQNNGNLPKIGANEQVEIKRQNSSGSDLSSDEDYVTPPSSPGNSSPCSTPEEPCTPEEGLEIYVEGALPSKADADILRVVENVPVDPWRFPHVYRWKHLMSSYDKQVIESWPSPSRRKFHEAVVRVKSRTPYRAGALSPSSETSDLSQAFTPVRRKPESFRRTFLTRRLY